MNTDQIKEMLKEICAVEISSKDELCRLDSFVGDGDHGFTVMRGFKGVLEMLDDPFDTSFELLTETGEELADSMGGAIGQIMGGFFKGGAEAVKGKQDIGTAELGAFLSGGLEGVVSAGGAKEGDCTLVDALAPAVRAYKAAETDSKDMKECIRAAAEGAVEGSLRTKEMAASRGRARFMQEKSRGYIDAGSVTMKLIIETMRDYIDKLN